MLRGIPMSGSFADDSICSGKSDNEHLEILRAMFIRFKEYNYRLSREKCEFMKLTLEYLGHVLTKEGIIPSPSKVEAIQSIAIPRNVSEVKSFLGLVNFYGKFIHTLSDISEPLNRLTRKDTDWNWTRDCDSAFKRIKSCLMSSQCLVHHDLNLPIGISCDASPIGLGVVLFHRYPNGIEKPIAFASKTLSQTERNYGQPEKEGLAIIFGVKKFYNYLCGRKFILVTDHQPLLTIFDLKRQLPSLLAIRLHRWSLYLSQFTYTVEYRNTLEHGNADALSRLPARTSNDVSPDIDSDINYISIKAIEVLPTTASKIRTDSSRDKVLSQIIRFINSKWPTSMKKDDELYPFYIRRDELSLCQGVVMWGVRIVIPTRLQGKILNELHESHFGIVRMKSLARQFVWWPGIDNNIESIVKGCTNCSISRKDPPSAPLHPWQFPERPWQRLHVDLAGPFLNSNWLIIMDARTK